MLFLSTEDNEADETRNLCLYRCRRIYAVVALNSTQTYVYGEQYNDSPRKEKTNQ